MQDLNIVGCHWAVVYFVQKSNCLLRPGFGIKCCFLLQMSALELQQAALEGLSLPHDLAIQVSNFYQPGFGKLQMDKNRDGFRNRQVLNFAFGIWKPIKWCSLYLSKSSSWSKSKMWHSGLVKRTCQQFHRPEMISSDWLILILVLACPLVFTSANNSTFRTFGVRSGLLVVKI